MIVVDNSYNRRLVTLNEDGTLDKEISCSHYPLIAASLVYLSRIHTTIILHCDMLFHDMVY
jgi:hypothetical protein